MNKRMVLAGMVLAAVVGLVGAPFVQSLAWAGNEHVAEALAEAKQAVEHGKAGHADVLVKHAETALNHAKGAQEHMKDAHLDGGIKELGEAVSHGKAGHADVATKHAEEAVKHLSEVK
jgi:long-subunit fatty acid transport protein